MADFITKETLDALTNKVRQLYRNEGYNGDFVDSAEFIMSDGTISLMAPDYTPFMLFGRKPGKMPSIKPILSWCRRYGITASPWAVRYNIGKYGTKGNNFIERNLSELTRVISDQVYNDIKRFINLAD